ncbi:hypothetical protein N9B12_00310 [bacterium]|nr:hypothetical protein [Mariniblastus sp.]MDA7887479.1 hypothetical protein [bacterium]MDA7926092.1 hypothetical protein [Mariniblastus sp.]MDC3225075.1 hypothetical protein [Mariniblastus sp.]
METAFSSSAQQGIILIPSVIKRTQKPVKPTGQKTPQTLISQLLRIKQHFQTRTALFVRINNREGKQPTPIN